MSSTTNERHYGIYCFISIIIFCGNLFLTTTKVRAQNRPDSLIYTVKPGDFLLKIAIHYGDADFWEPIFRTNRDKIRKPDLIYPGQKLVIPPAVTSSEKFNGPEDRGKKPAEATVSGNPKGDATTLALFRKAFRSVAGTDQQHKKKKPALDNGLEFGGLVINETRSKMGGDFFNTFYKYWNAPSGTDNFILTIAEQPIPSLGTLISVKIDDQTIFRSKLQPRFTVIERLAKQAVIVSYQTVQQRIETSSQLTSY